MTTNEVAEALGHSRREMVSQAIHNRTVLAVPYDFSGAEAPRIPRLLVEQLIPLYRKSKDGKRPTLPTQLIEWRESLYERAKELNKIGVNGTQIYHRTGPFKPIN